MFDQLLNADHSGIFYKNFPFKLSKKFASDTRIAGGEEKAQTLTIVLISSYFCFFR